MKILLVLLVLSSSSFAQLVLDQNGHPIIISGVPDKPDYNGPSPFTNPKVRNYFGSAGSKVEPALAAEIDRRISNAGGTHWNKSAHLTVYNGGEFGGKTLAQAIQRITDEWTQQSATGTPRAGLDKDGRDAAFFDSKHPAPNSPPVSASSPSSSGSLDEQVTASQAAAVEQWPELAVPKSRLNVRFVDEVKRLKKVAPEFFNNPQWPMILAKSCAHQTKSE